MFETLDDITVLNYVLIPAIVCMFIMIAIDIYLRKDYKKKMDIYLRVLKAKDEEMSNVLKSLRKLHESVEEVNKLKKEINEIKVSRK